MAVKSTKRKKDVPRESPKSASEQSQRQLLAGIHHLTAICSDAERTRAFYTSILGLRLVKKTVNFDAPESYHLYFGDRQGSPGSLITFFEWSSMEKGRWGIGSTHHLAFAVETAEAQLQWKRWLGDHGIAVTGPYDRTYFTSIYFEDPDGLVLEIATVGPGWAVDEAPDQLGTHPIIPAPDLIRGRRNEAAIERTTWAERVESITPSMRLKGLHHITAISGNLERSTDFYTRVLGLRLIKRTVNFDDPGSPHFYFAIEDGSPGKIVTLFGYTPERMRHSRLGSGLTHHFAFEVADDEVQRRWRSQLIDAGVTVTEILDRVYFKSIYFRDPDGHILEIATRGPGFAVDEEIAELGSSLKLPRWLESRRKEIEDALVPLEELAPRREGR